jgi:F0F1-type ATP synthase epsilon subunit
MKSKHLHVSIISSEQTLFEWEVEKITVPCDQGMLTILRDHMPLLSHVKKWTVRIEPIHDGETFIESLQDKHQDLSVNDWFILVNENTVKIIVN